MIADRALLAVALAAALAGPIAAAEHVPAPEGAVRWLAPADGARLDAEGRVELAWEPGPAFPPQARFEEWEVFLSLDGGRTWSVRLTPHLAAERRRVVVDLPGLESADARLLLRFGDERLEFDAELPVRLRLVRAGGLRPLRGGVTARPSLRPAESARPGQRGVVLFAHGSRRGGDPRWLAAPRAAGWRESSRWSAAPPLLVLAPPAPRPGLAAPAAAEGAGAERLGSALCPPRTPLPGGAGIPPRLATCRRNE